MYDNVFLGLYFLLNRSITSAFLNNKLLLLLEDVSLFSRQHIWTHISCQLIFILYHIIAIPYII